MTPLKNSSSSSPNPYRQENEESSKSKSKISDWLFFDIFFELLILITLQD
jgi:hypothetical protein